MALAISINYFINECKKYFTYFSKICKESFAEIQDDILKEMRFRSIGGNIKYIDSSYESASLLLATEKLVKETLAVKIGDDIILINDDNVDYYTVIAKKGLSYLGAMAAKIVAGTPGYAAAHGMAGGGYLGKAKLVFVKLVDGEYILVQVEEGNMHLIRSRHKISQNKLAKSEKQLIDSVIDKLLEEEGTSREELATKLPVADDDNDEEEELL